MNVFIIGIGGKMGRALCERAAQYDCVITGGLDKVKTPNCPTFENISDINVPIDAVIDFSRPVLLDGIIELCVKLRCPCVLATTGYDEEQERKIKQLSESVAVFKSENMSLGVNVLSILAEQAASILKNFDIEIIERHHNQKADAPSGTAKLLLNSIEKGLATPSVRVYGREGNSKRNTGEIGIHSVRGGSVVGEHEVGFYGNDEVITLSHSAGSRKIFADGALKAAKWILNKKPGLYDMHDMLGL